MHRITTPEATRDEGTVLVLSLVLGVVLGALACAIAAYAVVGLRTTGVTDRRLQRVAATDAGLRAAGEMLKSDPGYCAAGAVNSIEFMLDGASVEAWCETNGAATSEWRPYLLHAKATRGTAVVEGVAEVQGRTSSYRPCSPGGRCIITINSWAVNE